MVDRFVRLCETASPTGEERAVADAVAAELREAGLEVEEDGSAGPARAGSGNLIARVPGSGDRWVLFCAHLDTVPHSAPIEVELQDGVFRSRGDTILGADNKAAVTVLCELALRARQHPGPAGLELVFTVAEEDGLRGAKELDLGALRSSFGYVMDHASPIGEVITAAPTHNKVLAEFEGEEAHAGIRPEAGHSAIAAAAAAIASMPLGRLDEETTANVGLISGGTATNVVAGSCRVGAEARSLNEARAAETTQALVDACTWAASEHRCDVDVDVVEVSRVERAGRPDRPRGARARGHRAARGRHRGRKRRERAHRSRVRMRPARERHGGKPHLRRERGGAANRRDARGLRGDRGRRRRAGVSRC
jgi:tripeptide aminopeptidase